MHLNRLLGLFLVVIWLPMGCGDNGGNGTENQDTDNDPAAKPVEFVTWWNNAADAAAAQVLLTAYRTAVPDGEVTLTAGDWDATEAVIKARIDTTTAPDVVHRMPRHLPSLYAFGEVPHNVLYPLDEAVDAASKAGFVPEILDMCSKDGKLYALPVSMHRIIGMFYNPAAFDNAGVTMPTSLDGLIAAAATLKAAGTPFAISVPNHGSKDLFYYAIHATNGGQFLKDLLYGNLDWEADGVAAKMEVAVDKFIEAIAVFDVVGLEDAVEKMDANAAFEALYAGEISGFLYPDWMKSWFTSSEKAWTVGQEFNIVSPPGMSDFFLYIVDALTVPVGATHRANGLEFIRAASTAETINTLTSVKGANPTRTDNTTGLDAIATQTIQDMSTASLIVAEETPATEIWGQQLMNTEQGQYLIDFVVAYYTDPAAVETARATFLAALPTMYAAAVAANQP